MATLLLTAAGSLLGPIGSAAGALIGQAIDSRILKPKGREGPRLQDLRIQTSSYGAPIPKLFGTMRVAGTVIWSTDLIEQRTRRSGGKGRPSTTSYNYSASFAVALSTRPILAVRRIWADGNLLRGAGGDWKQETGFRLHLGDEDQAPDPFISSAESGDGTPAYRGCAYAVFENMALEPYGNRIPSLTFEVEADAASVTLSRMLGELADGAIGGAGGPALAGYAASGDNVAGLIASLGEAFPLTLFDTGEQLEAQTSSAPIVIDAAEIAEGSQRRQPGAAEAPASVSISHYDPARDFQIGTQACARGPGRKAERIDLPAALFAGEARALAEAVLERRRRERTGRSVTCGWRRLAAAPGALVRIGEEAAVWRVVSRSVDRAGVRLELRSERSASFTARLADPGRDLPAPDRLHGPSRVALLDLPNLADDAPTTAALGIAAWGAMPGWRRAALLVSLDQGNSWEPIGATALPAVAGVSETALPIGSTGLVDQTSTLIVQLAHQDMALEDADDDRLLAGANLAVVGGELIQFGAAAPLGAGRWQLARLLRGRGGTEWAAASHAPGESFVLIERETVTSHALPLAAVGSEVRVMASGLGDTVPVQAMIDWNGEALRPPSPVHLTARPSEDAGFDIVWMRRSRAGWAWSDLDAPLAEALERYRAVIRRADGVERAIELADPTFRYQADAMLSDRAVGDHVDILVVQLGTSGISRPATLRINL